MSDKKNNTAAEKSAADVFKQSEAELKTAETAKNDAIRAFTQLGDTSTDVQKEAAEKLMTETRTAFEEINGKHQILVDKRDGEKTKKVRILLPVAGLFHLPYDIDQEVDLPAGQADEVVAAKYGEFVK